MNKSIRSFKQGAQAGFTLIELVVVIVILGILAATAIPKFVDMAADARAAKVSGARGSIQAAASLVHAQWLVSGSPTGAITLENTPISMSNGYPDGLGIGAAAGISADFDIATTAPTATLYTLNADTTHTSCKITYTAATATAPPIISAAPKAASC